MLVFFGNVNNLIHKNYNGCVICQVWKTRSDTKKVKWKNQFNNSYIKMNLKKSQINREI